MPGTAPTPPEDPRPPVLSGELLDLHPLGADALAAWVDGDAAALTALTGAVFPDPAVAPPLMDDALPFVRDRLRGHPAELGWWAWLCVDRAGGEVVGSAGFAGPPGADGAVVLGYATYPRHAGRGAASEAADLLAGWALRQPGVRVVRVTVPVDHVASLRVAARAGFTRTGTGTDPEAGEVAVLERTAGGAPPAG
ncbi:GNAT family N-acetyltransferase [Kineococcus glutinatus]|uniref:N-acetyltransferase domain-containing protein n=1 Tax=Kineococcus glutinatus TaxID=1070872 RepID=A0ABP9H978_9ACTN